MSSQVVDASTDAAGGGAHQDYRWEPEGAVKNAVLLVEPVEDVSASEHASAMGTSSSVGERADSGSPDGSALTAFKAAAKDVLREFFASGDAQTAYNSLSKLDGPYFRYEVVKCAVSLALDGGNRERELASQLLSALHGAGYLTMGAVGKGFERLYESASDLLLDVPDAEIALAKFTARAVVDDILPPAFLTTSHVEAAGGDIIARARVMLSVKHAGIRIERVWGANEANSDVGELKAAFQQIVAEYFDSKDGAEAVRCVKAMGVPHLGHALVKRAFTSAWDKRQPMSAVVQLLKTLFEEGALSEAQLVAGLQYVRDDMSDLALDAPQAPAQFQDALAQAKAAGMPVV